MDVKIPRFLKKIDYKFFGEPLRLGGVAGVSLVAVGPVFVDIGLIAVPID